ncbi:hypothetical protein ACFOYU_13165 [Microvirga sp. GCM10011540]|uniref:hypothetical protein n=1 Tax=Microvirga sp. GCM10011540 TaxID=3317338 RepID=UPI00361CFACF
MSHGAALDLAKHLNLNGATHFEPSSEVIFGFNNRDDAFWFRFANQGSVCQLHVLDSSGMVLVGASVDCVPNLVSWLDDHLAPGAWGMTEYIRVSFTTDAERCRFEAACKKPRTRRPVAKACR